MLVLSRKIGEEIVIGEGIVLKVVDIRGDKTRIGITAPQEVRVDRKEVAEERAAGLAAGLIPQGVKRIPLVKSSRPRAAVCGG